jgi:Flp pilus assembly protein protease CpaA
MWWQMLLAAALALAVSLPLYLRGGLGGGDVKLLAGLATWLGPVSLWPALFWTAAAGLLLALVAAAQGHRQFAYGPAIAAAFTVQVLWPTAIGQLVQWAA